MAPQAAWQQPAATYLTFSSVRVRHTELLTGHACTHATYHPHRHLPEVGPVPDARQVPVGQRTQRAAAAVDQLVGHGCVQHGTGTAGRRCWGGGSGRETVVATTADSTPFFLLATRDGGLLVQCTRHGLAWSGRQWQAMAWSAGCDLTCWLQIKSSQGRARQGDAHRWRARLRWPGCRPGRRAARG